MPKLPIEARKNLENVNIQTLFSMCTLTPNPWGLHYSQYETCFEAKQQLTHYIPLKQL